MKRWTSEEVVYLKQTYGKKTLQQMVVEMDGRTAPSISYKALSLGIRLSRRYVKPTDYNFSDYQKGFLVGIIEGEGNISIQLSRYGTRLSPVLEIGNTDIDIIKVVQEIIGGTIYTTKRSRDNYKDCYHLKLLKLGEIYGVVKALQPYLISKKKRAELMLEFIRSRMERWEKYGCTIPYSDREIETAEQLRTINTQRGKRPKGKFQRLFAKPIDQIILQKLIRVEAKP